MGPRGRPAPLLVALALLSFSLWPLSTVRCGAAPDGDEGPPAAPTIEAAWGVGGLDASSRLGALSVTVRGDQETSLPSSGALAVRLTRHSPIERRATWIEYAFPLEVPAWTSHKVWLALPHHRVGSDVSVTWRPAGTLGRHATVHLEDATVVPPGSMALVLGRPESGWEWLSGWRFADAPEALRVAHVERPADVPPWFLAYQGVSLIVLDASFHLEQLSGEQQRALVAYARAGSPLVVPSPLPPAWRTTAIGRHLSADPDAAVTVPLATPSSSGQHRLAPALGMVPASPATATRWDDFAAEDALRRDVLDALLDMPVPVPPRWPVALAAVVYATVAWMWFSARRHLRPTVWVGLGLGALALAVAAGSVAGRARLEAADQPVSALIVRPASWTYASEPGTSAPPGPDPLQAELLIVFPRLSRGPWDIRPAREGWPLLPGVLSPGEMEHDERLQVRLAGVRATWAGAGHRDRPSFWAWRLEGEEETADSSVTPGVPWRPGRAGAWAALLYVDAPGYEPMGPAYAEGRAVLMSRGGVVGLPGMADLVPSGAVSGSAAAGAALAAGEARLLPGDAGTLTAQALEHLSPAPSREEELEPLARAASSMVARTAARSPEHLRTPPRYWVAVGTAAGTPAFEVRRPGRPWVPLWPVVVAMGAAGPITSSGGAATTP